MNENNYDYLAKQLMYTGFPESLEKELKEKMTLGEPAFVLTHHAEMKKDQVDATLFFKKGETENYFFNTYHLRVKAEGAAEGLGQTFYISNKRLEEGQEKHKRDFTLKEAYNVLAKADNKEEQRFVYGKWAKKTGEVYNAWKGINLDEKDKNGNSELKAYHDSYGFKLDKSLVSLPIREADKNDPEIIKSLQKGNLQMVKNDAGDNMYISAFPPGRRINLFDKEMKLVNGRENVQAQVLGEGKGPANGKQQAAVKAPVNGAVNEPELGASRPKGRRR